MIAIEDIKKIKEKIDTLKAKKSKAEGVMESIKKRWKDEFQCDDLPAVEAKIKSLVDDIKEGERRIAVLLARIESSYDWDSVS